MTTMSLERSAPAPNEHISTIRAGASHPYASTDSAVAPSLLPASESTEGTLVLDETMTFDRSEKVDGIVGEPIWVDWDGPNDPANPRNWSRRKRWMLSSSGIMFCAIVSLSVSGYSISTASVQSQLHASKELSLLGITMFTLTFGGAPLILAPFSEVYGRSYIYFFSALVFTIFFIPQALATNIETMLIARFISGIAGSSAVSLVGGTLADVWNDEERGLPMSWFAFSAFGSTGLGPVMFGYVEQYRDFRLIQWITMAASGVFTIILAFIVLPNETRASVLLSRKAARLRKETGDTRYQSKADAERGSFAHMMSTSLSRPVKMLCREPVLISFTAYISFCWGVLYIQLVSLPIVWRELYNFTIGESGLTYTAQVLGSAIGLFIDHFCDKKYLKEVGRRGPEARLYSAMIGGVLVPLGCITYTFTSYPQVPWIIPCLCITLMYIGILLIYLACFSYLADAYTMYASSALSAMSFARNLVGAVFPLFTTQMYERLGIQGAGGLTSGLAFLLSVIPFVLFLYGAKLRAKSPFAQELEKMKREAQVMAQVTGKEVIIEPEGVDAPTVDGDVAPEEAMRIDSKEMRKGEV